MKLLRKIIQRYPYRGLFGWATVCVWAFVLSEILWHLSGFVRRYDLLEIVLAVPYAPLAFLVDPHDLMLHHRHVFFFALANWSGIFVIGTLLSLKRMNAVVSGSAVGGLLLFAALARNVEYWIINPPGPIP